MPDGLSTWKLNYQGSREKIEKSNNTGAEKMFVGIIILRERKY